MRREAGGFGRYLVSRLEGSGPSVRHRPCAQRRAGPGRAGPGDAGAETGGPNLQGLKTSSPNPESFRPVQKTQWLCVRNPLLAPKNVWCLGGTRPRKTLWPQPAGGPGQCGRESVGAGERGAEGRGQAGFPWECSSYGLQLGREGRSGGHGKRVTARQLRAGGEGGGCGGAWRG